MAVLARPRHFILWLTALLLHGGAAADGDERSAACAALTPPGRRSSSEITKFDDPAFAIGRKGCEWSPGEVFATVGAVAADGRVVVTSSNAGFWEFTDAFLDSLARAGVPNAVVIAEDNATVARYERTHPGQVIHFELFGASTAHDFRSNMYHVTVSRRAVYLWRLLALGFSPLWSDADIIWLTSPWPEILRSAGSCDVMVQSDAACRFVGEQGGWCTADLTAPETGAVPKPEHIREHRGSNSLLCTGLVFAQPTASVLSFLSDWDAALQERVARGTPGLNQPLFNEVLLRQQSDLLRPCYLSRVRFPTGYLFFNETWRARHTEAPVAVHLNWVGSAAAKRKRAAELGVILAGAGEDGGEADVPPRAAPPRRLSRAGRAREAGAAMLWWALGLAALWVAAAAVGR